MYFESGHAEIEKRMLKRGMEFLALAKTEASHKEYQGVSIDDSAEEVILKIGPLPTLCSFRFSRSMGQ